MRRPLSGEVEIDENQVRRWRNNPVFEERVLSAKQVAIERLEFEADRRGYTGVRDAVFCKGVHVGDRTRYSDALLMFRLKALAPDDYRKQLVPVVDMVTVAIPDNGRDS